MEGFDAKSLEDMGRESFEAMLRGFKVEFNRLKLLLVEKDREIRRLQRKVEKLEKEKEEWQAST